MELPVHVRNVLEQLKKAERVLIVAHHDADGVSSAGVLLRSLDADLVILRQLYASTIPSLPLPDYDFVLFVDLGGRYIDEMARHTDHFLVVDHHDLDDVSSPHLFHPSHLSYNPDLEASSSTLSALISHFLHPSTETLVLGLVGASGDRQFVGGKFSGLNRVFVVRGIREGILTVYRDLTLPSLRYRGIGEALLESTDPILPGLTGNPEGVYNLLERSGILSLDPSGRIRYRELDLEHRRRFYTALHLHLLSHGWSEEELKSLIGEIYELNDYPALLSTIRSFSTVANAIGKLMRVELVRPLFTDPGSVMFNLFEVAKEYTSIMYKAVRWALEHREDLGSFYFADLRGRFPPFVSGAAAEAISSGKIGVSVVEDEEGYVKLSLRGGAGLSEVVKRVVEKVGGEGGGHSRAAGARIPVEKLDEFLSFLSEELKA